MPTFNAANAAQLIQAVASAKGGDVIVLAGGDYGDVMLNDARFFSDVTIRSANAARSGTLQHPQGLALGEPVL